MTCVFLFIFTFKAIDCYITGHPFFLSRLELFQERMQNYREKFGMCSVGSQSDQGFYLIGQLLNFSTIVAMESGEIELAL